MAKRSWAEPYKIKMVEHLRMITRGERDAAIREAGRNTLRLCSARPFGSLHRFHGGPRSTRCESPECGGVS